MSLFSKYNIASPSFFIKTTLKYWYFRKGKVGFSLIKKFKFINKK